MHESGRVGAGDEIAQLFRHLLAPLLVALRMEREACDHGRDASVKESRSLFMRLAVADSILGICTT